MDWVALYVSHLPVSRRIDAYANFIVQVHLERRDVEDKLKCLMAGEQCVGTWCPGAANAHQPLRACSCFACACVFRFMPDELVRVVRRAVARLIELPDPVTGHVPDDARSVDARTRSRLTAVSVRSGDRCVPCRCPMPSADT